MKPSLEDGIRAGFEEVLGEDDILALIGLMGWGTDSIHNQTLSKLQFSYTGLTAILKEIEFRYGELSGCGIAWRAGQAGFKYILRTPALKEKLASIEFKLMPLPSKLNTFLSVCQQCFETFVPFQVEESTIGKENIIGWEHPGQPHVKAVLYWLAGFITEGVYWFSGGKINQIHPLKGDQNAYKVGILNYGER
ncbi:MAG: hypothetical protein JXA19_04820 [Anaerolineales bacterium]|nr:hypothetical protein [Anaerolineales bacterium]